MTYSEFQNQAEDGAERHQSEVKTGLAKMYADGRRLSLAIWIPKTYDEMLFDVDYPFGWEGGTV